jgi:glycosyltransferase involved in cell wall biosynthesis
LLYVFPKSKSNSFASDLCKIFQSQGLESKTIALRDLLRLLTRKSGNSSLVLNWIESYLVVDGNFSFARYIKLSVTLMLLRGRGYRLVHIQHDEYPHLLELKERCRFDKYFGLFKKIFNKTQKFYEIGTKEFILHPLPSKPLVTPSVFVEYDLLIFGSIMRYKSIEIVLQALKNSESYLRVCVAGEAADPGYLTELKAIEYESVTFIPNWIPEIALDRLIKSSKAVGTFNRFGSSYVSGTVFKALVLDVPVISFTSGYLEAMLLKKPQLPIKIIASMTALEEAVESLTAQSTKTEYFSCASIFQCWNRTIYV